MDASFEYYRIFYYVATYGSMTQAAQYLHTDQPNVSRIIKKLEYEAGFLLFSRAGNSLKLTDQGKRIYTLIKPAIEQIENAQKQIESERELISNNISIACNGSAIHYIQPKLKEFKTSNRNVNVKLKTLTSGEAIELVENEGVDVGLITGDAREIVGLDSRILAEFHDVLTVGYEKREFAERVHSIKDFENEDFILLPEKSRPYNFFMEFMQKYDFTPKSSLEVSRSEQVAMMVMYNWGIGFLPDFLVEETRKKEAPLYPVKLKEEIPPRYIKVITKASRTMSPATEKFFKYIFK